MVETGDTAPDFTLTGAQGDEIREFTLSAFADGRPAVLVFYIHDFSPVCTDQMCEINDMEFLTFNDDAAVVGISTDGPFSHREFIQDNDISYPLLSDVDKEIYEAYGMTERDDEKNGTRNEAWCSSTATEPSSIGGRQRTTGTNGRWKRSTRLIQKSESWL